mmetsp:Transcript_25074/g.70233  ORF Transcript_25074/g.70233 Transcript_25074/m.70233 type:complete len:207 (-) Transcript_25074:14-634(-)
MRANALQLPCCSSLRTARIPSAVATVSSCRSCWCCCPSEFMGGEECGKLAMGLGMLSDEGLVPMGVVSTVETKPLSAAIPCRYRASSVFSRIFCFIHSLAPRRIFHAWLRCTPVTWLGPPARMAASVATSMLRLMRSSGVWMPALNMIRARHPFTYGISISGRRSALTPKVTRPWKWTMSISKSKNPIFLQSTATCPANRLDRSRR